MKSQDCVFSSHFTSPPASNEHSASAAGRNPIIRRLSPKPTASFADSSFTTRFPGLSRDSPYAVSNSFFRGYAKIRVFADPAKCPVHSNLRTKSVQARQMVWHQAWPETGNPARLRLACHRSASLVLWMQTHARIGACSEPCWRCNGRTHYLDPTGGGEVAVAINANSRARYPAGFSCAHCAPCWFAFVVVESVVAIDVRSAFRHSKPGLTEPLKQIRRD